MPVDVYAKHEPYTDGHLGKVANEMMQVGPPTLRVMRFKGKYYALEGSHRLAAAKHFGLIPKLVVQIEDTDVLPDDHWEIVAEKLPQYNFNHVLVLDLNKFEAT